MLPVLGAANTPPPPRSNSEALGLRSDGGSRKQAAENVFFCNSALLNVRIFMGFQ